MQFQGHGGERTGLHVVVLFRLQRRVSDGSVGMYAYLRTHV